MSLTDKHAAPPPQDHCRYRLDRTAEGVNMNKDTADAYDRLAEELAAELESRRTWSIEVQREIDEAHRQLAAARRLLLRWLQAHNKMDGKAGMSISEFDALRRETDAAMRDERKEGGNG